MHAGAPVRLSTPSEVGTEWSTWRRLHLLFSGICWFRPWSQIWATFMQGFRMLMFRKGRAAACGTDTKPRHFLFSSRVLQELWQS